MLQYTYTNVRINIYMYYYTCINILLYIYTHIHTYIYVYVWLVRKCIMAVPWRGPRVLINLSSANFKKKHLLRIYSLMMFDWSMSPFAFSARREKDIVALNKHSPCSPQVQEGTCWMSGTKLCQGLAGNKVSRIKDRSGHHWFWGYANQIHETHKYVQGHMLQYVVVVCICLCVYMYYICLYRPRWLVHAAKGS